MEHNNNTSTSSENQAESKRNYFTPRIASKYLNTIFTSPLHNDWISSLIYDSLELRPGHRLVDIGCGLGLESRILLNKMNNEIHIIGVDPSQGMIDEFRKESGTNPNIETVCMDAVTFSQSTDYSPYDRIFLKSMIHLLTQEERLIAFKGFYRQLAPNNGKLLIIRTPPVGVISPFDERTTDLFRKTREVETLVDELKQAGFKRIEEQLYTLEYPPNSVTAEDWIHIVENRLWTPLSKENINDEQMKDLIDHIKRQYASPNSFQTTDKQIFIKCCVA